MIALLAALSARHGIGQARSLPFPVNTECVELNQTVVAQAVNGRMAEAERTLSAVVSGGGAGRAADPCAGLALSNMAAVLLAAGRLVEGERLAERGVAVLDKLYSPDDLVLLRPLQVLAVIRFEQGKTGRAREAVRKIQSIRVERPLDRALVHGMTASLLYTQHRLPEAETEYLASLAAWEEAGSGNTADAGAVLGDLGTLYMDEQRFPDARRTLDHALIILASASDAVPLDRIKLLNARGVLHARRQEWPEAQQDLREALSAADGEPWVSPDALRTILTNYAHALRKNHLPQEARPIEARLSALSGPRPRDLAVDVTELMPGKK